MRPPAHAAAIVGALLLLFGPWSAASAGPAAGSQDIMYLGPGAVVGPTGALGLPTSPSPCRSAPCIEGVPSAGALAVLPPDTVEVTLRIHDDLAGQLVWGALCLSAARDGSCARTDTIIGPVCGPFRATFLPPPGEVLVYAVSVPGDASCSDPTKGTARIDHST